MRSSASAIFTPEARCLLHGVSRILLSSQNRRGVPGGGGIDAPYAKGGAAANRNENKRKAIERRAGKLLK